MRSTSAAIGSNVQAYDADLQRIASLSCSNQVIEMRVSMELSADNTRRRLEELDAGINHPLFASDLRMKDDVSRFPQTKSASEVISTLNIYSFKFKNNTHGMHNYGVSAKELYEKTNYIVKKGDDKLYKINTQSLIAFMLQSIKELKLENKQLNERLMGGTHGMP